VTDCDGNSFASNDVAKKRHEYPCKDEDILNDQATCCKTNPKVKASPQSKTRRYRKRQAQADQVQANKVTNSCRLLPVQKGRRWLADGQLWPMRRLVCTLSSTDFPLLTVSHRYHFGCINLSEQTAEDISKPSLLLFSSSTNVSSDVYICPSCTEKTGHRTVSEYLFPLWPSCSRVMSCTLGPSLYRETRPYLHLAFRRLRILLSRHPSVAYISQISCICVVPSELVWLS
jgi:hypothetical protein